MKRTLTFLLIITCLLAGLSWGKVLSPTDEQKYVARYMARFFPRQHLTQLMLDDQLSERIWNNYINSLDYERVYFLQSDITSFQKEIRELDDDIKKGDLSFAFHVYDVFKDRLTNRCAYVETILEKDWDFEKKEVYRWKRKNAPWPNDEAEWNDIWRKRIKNEFLRRKVASMLDEEKAAEKKEIDTSAPAATNTTDEVSEKITPPTTEETISKRYDRLRTVIEDNDSDYVVQRFLTAFANAYDPHSSYMAPTTLEDFDIEMKLSLVGIGAVLQSEDGAAKIVRLIAGGPASQDKRDSRLREGDKIIGVGQGDDEVVDVLHWPLSKMVQKIRGEKGTKVVLLVIPASDPSGSSTKIVDLIRDEVKLEEQAVKWTLHEAKDTNGKERRLALIDIPAFYANLRASKGDSDYRSSADDVKKALLEISTNNVDGVILDLRNNGGGSLVDSVRMTGLFIPSGPAVQVKESSNRGRVLTDDDPELVYDGPLLVMVNRLSASASEILAAALQDYGRAVVVGDSRTHGKGTVQTVVNVGRNPEFGAIKLTTAVFYRITGDSTQLRGVIPDIYIPSPYDYMELGEDSLKYPVEWTRVAPCKYRKFDDPDAILDELSKRSDARRADSEEFKIYNKLMKQIESVYESETLPLDLASRIKQSRTEREILDLQRKLSEQSKDDGEDDKERKDLVMQESLQILADMVSLQYTDDQVHAKPAQPNALPGVVERIKEWLTNED